MIPCGLSQPDRSRPSFISGMLLSGVVCAATVGIGVAEKPTSSLELLVHTIGQHDDDSVRESLLRGILHGLEGRRNINAPKGWERLAAELSDSQSTTIRDQATRLSQIFGNQAATDRAIAALRDPQLPARQRRSALRSLVEQRYPGLTSDLVTLLDDPELKIEAIRAFGVLADEKAPQLMLSRYQQESAEVQRAIIETLATRKPYAVVLVRGIKDGVVAREHVPSYVARAIRDVVGKPFTEVYGPIAELDKNISETIAKYKRLITSESLRSADAGRGRVVFERTCGACHQMYGVGGAVGPDLTGSNRANLDYLLLNSIDPSGDVPEGYRTEMIQTVDGRILTGVLAEEDAQRIVLKTVDQPRLVIVKEDIESRKVSAKSMMPEGQLDQLKRTDLFDLVKYMQTKSQVEAAK